ncbi:MAG: hypothetical protein DRI61_09820 [Chloroflexi bacterium]|nr:MAG: hypothetical protein DRI61_09820 [Chloroflexota bacterium]
MKFENVLDIVTPNIWKYLEDVCSLEEEEIRQVLKKLKIDSEKFFKEFSNQGYTDEELLQEILEKEYPKEEYFILIDFIEENIGYFHIRVWRYIS